MNSSQAHKVRLKARRKARVRKKVVGTAARPRLSVFRSAKHIYAQIINDEQGITLVAASSLKLPAGGNKKIAEEVGQLLGTKAKAAAIERVVFDRNGCLYHGRIKVLADAVRGCGIQF